MEPGYSRLYLNASKKICLISVNIDPRSRAD